MKRHGASRVRSASRGRGDTGSRWRSLFGATPALRNPLANLPNPKTAAERALCAAVDRAPVGRSKEREGLSGNG